MNELIEKLGKDQVINIHYYPKAKNPKWEAKRSNPKYQECSNCNPEYFIGKGKTAKEAVENLLKEVDPLN